LVHIGTKYYQQFINKQGKYFIKVHEFYMEDLNTINKLLSEIGFKMVEVLDYKTLDIDDMIMCIIKKL